jgi:hypothetical protein
LLGWIYSVGEGKGLPMSEVPYELESIYPQKNEVYIIVEGRKIQQIMVEELNRRDARAKNEQVRGKFTAKDWESETGINDNIINGLLNGDKTTMSHETMDRLLNYFDKHHGKAGVVKVLLALGWWKKEYDD